MLHRSSLVFSTAIGVLTVGWFACSPSGSGTAEGSGGSTASSNGGQPGAGGTSSSGGQVSSGGKVGTGGASSTGGTTVSGTGGSGAGGTSAQGSGGASTTGGRSGSGGASGAGGSSSSGGQPGSGGESATGGRSGSGGTPGTGGAAGGRDGGAATGGAGGTTSDAGGTPPSGLSAGCGKTPTLTSSQYNNGNPIAITVGGTQRRYILSVPTNYDNTKPYKFVLGIHALDSNDKTVYSWQYYGLQPLSNNTTIFAAPNGQKNGAACSGTGTGESGCGWPSGNLPLMDAVVKQVTDNFCVDTNRIFATGWSYGASMSYEVGCARPLGGPTATADWGVRAIATYSLAQMSGSCKPSVPIGYYLSHGTTDNVLTYDGGVNLTKNYATTNGCTWATPPKASGSHICTNLSGCKTGYPVEFCSFVGGHTPFPDSGTQSSSWGPAEVWKFLNQF